MALNKGFVSNAAGFICWLSLMMVSAAVANALQATMNVGGNPKLVFTLAGQGGCFNHITAMQVIDFRGLH
ncbi:unnamed protein product, partial [Vitis vinifera]